MTATLPLPLDFPMPFIPHTDHEIAQMLDTIGASSIEDLFDEIPKHLRAAVMSAIPSGMTEMEISRLMRQRAEQNTKALFLEVISNDYKQAVGSMLSQISIAQNDNWKSTSQKTALYWNNVMKEKIQWG